MSGVRLWLAAVALLMAGCANLPSAEQPRDVTESLAKYQGLAALTAEQRRQELGAAQADYERAANDVTRLNLALALLSQRATERDDARIQSLLNAIEAAPDEQGLARRGLAELLHDLLAERQRELRDSRRKQEQLARHLRDEQRKTETLKHKIESLRAIDRDMMLQRKIP